MAHLPMDAEPLEHGGARHERRGYAVAAVVLGGLFAFLSSGAALYLFRDTLHFNCSYLFTGEAGEWVCADGIGYMVVAVGLGGMSAMLLLVGLFVAIGKPSRLSAATLMLFASVSLAWISWWSFYPAAIYTGSRPPGETGLGLWMEAVFPSLVVSVLGLLIGVIGVAVGRRWSLVGVTVGACLIVLGAAFQFGIGVSTLVAAGLVAAAGVQRYASR